MSSPPPPDPRLAATAATIAAYQAQTSQLRQNLEDFIRRLWLSLGQYRDPQLVQFLEQAVPVVIGAQQSMAGLTAASLAAQQEAAVGGLGLPAAIDAAKVTGMAARNGTDPAEVYGRPFHLVWRQLADLPRQAGSIEQAIDAGLNRAVDLAMTDLQLTKVATSQKALASDAHVTGYRRVLEGPHSCGLCIVASTQRYHKQDLMPIHPGCDCSTAPIYGDHDPGPTITSMVNVDGQMVPVADLPDVHDRIEQRFGTSSSAARGIPGARDARGRILQYRDALIVHEHGELGRVLAVRGAPFLGPNDL